MDDLQVLIWNAESQQLVNILNNKQRIFIWFFLDSALENVGYGTQLT